MSASPEIAISASTFAAIAERFGLGTRTATRLAHSGTSNSIYFLDDAFVLRVPDRHPVAASGVANEALIVPAARAAGVRTPALVAVDTALDLLPVPYAIYERAHGVSLELLGLAADVVPEVWRQLGQDLARLHAGVGPDGPLGQLPADEADLDPRPWLAEIAAAGFIPAPAAERLQLWLDRLAPLALAGPPRCFCHGDVNVGNVLVHPQSHAYVALIDWSGAVWGDSAWDCAVVSLVAAPWLLEGYRSVAPMPEDATAEARILWHHLRLGLYGMRRAPQHGQDWAARRLDRLAAGMRAFLATPGAQSLAQLGPPIGAVA